MSHETRKTADRVRPFLKAMERSIQHARDRRTGTTASEPRRSQVSPPSPPPPGARPHPMAPQPLPMNHSSRGLLRNEEHDEQPAGPPRLKARPKRPISR